MGAVTSRRPTSSASPSGAAAKPSAPSGAVQLHVQSLPVPDGVRKSGRSGSASGQAALRQPGGLLVQFQGSEEQISSLVMIEGPDFCNLVMDVPLGVTIILMRRERDTNLSWTCRTCPGLGLQGTVEMWFLSLTMLCAVHHRCPVIEAILDVQLPFDLLWHTYFIIFYLI